MAITMGGGANRRLTVPKPTNQCKLKHLIVHCNSDVISEMHY